MKKLPLQKGAKMLREPVKKQIGAWSPLTFDATITLHGVRWLRVKDGLGGRGDREDWVADIPAVCVSVHDYHWNGSDFGPNYGSFRGAIKAEMKLSLAYAIKNEKEMLAKAREQAQAVVLLRQAIGRKP